TFEESQWGVSCWERLASHPTRPVVAPAGLPDDDPPPASPPLFRYPTAERRFVLCIDRSSDESTGGDARLGYEKQAASVFIDLLPDGDELAVVSFAGHASVDFVMTALDSTAREAAKEAVAALDAEGPTSISAGLTAARDVLTAQSGVPCAQSIILLTDGLGNTGVDELSIVPSLIEAEISVVTIAVGTSVSVANLQSIATDTGGRFLVLPGLGEFAPLVAALSADVVGGAANSEVGSTVAEGDTVDVQVIVDDLMEDVTFVLAWPDFKDDLDLFLKTPSGRIITFADALSDPNIVFVDENGSEIFILGGAAVEDGIWSVLVAGRQVIDDGSFCLLTIHARESAIMIGAPERPTYDLTEAITLTATPRFLGNAVAGATVTGSFTRPDGTGGSLVLRDDGLAPDAVAGDGVYATLFDDFQGVAGAYSFGLEVENVSGTTFGGEGHYASVGAPIFSEPAPPFVRIASTSAVVSEVNSAPLVTCTGLADVECGPEAIAHVEATVFDADGDGLTVTWNVDGQDVAVDQVPGGGPPTQAVVPFDQAFSGTGVHVITARVDDGVAPVPCATTVTVADHEPPSFSISLDREVLWPPDGGFVTVQVDAIALSDACDGEPAFELTTIRHDEADDGGDVLGAEFGTPDTEFQLRAERDLTGDGREYTVVYTAFDAGGNTAEQVLVVTVPRILIESDVFGDEAGFTPDGTDLLDGVRSFRLVVPGDGASAPDPERAHLACAAGALRPLSV
ncbi:MAG: VWA domain-containing protein, partial [bacterium]